MAAVKIFFVCCWLKTIHFGELKKNYTMSIVMYFVIRKLSHYTQIKTHLICYQILRRQFFIHFNDLQSSQLIQPYLYGQKYSCNPLPCTILLSSWEERVTVFKHVKYLPQTHMKPIMPYKKEQHHFFQELKLENIDNRGVTRDITWILLLTLNNH